MKTFILTLCFCPAVLFVSAQNANAVKEIDQLITPASALAPLRFLASDELMGRGTMRPEINIAARYISEQFRSFGLKEVPGTNDYFQTFDIRMKNPATSGTLTVSGNTYEMINKLLQAKGGDITVNAPVVYAKHGTENDLNNIDVKGKIVITEPGTSDSSSFMDGFYMLETKRKLLQNKGAVAIIERFKEGSFPWNGLQEYLTEERAVKEEGNSIPVLFVKDDASSLKNIAGNTQGSLIVQGTQIRAIPAKNVMGWVEGTDPKLKEQFVVLTAHYDHLGVAKKPKMEEGKLDSIYNGARDNAIGTTAVMDAAQYFAEHPAKRSILFIAYAAEEVGEIGSKYFSEHPTIPLKQMVYNINIDNASYNDTSIVTVVGLGRTSADEEIRNATAAYGLKAMPDPAPEQNLFDRSDNVNLAVHGIPAPTFSLGFTKFDEEINKRYHQLSDEVGNFDLNYGLKYIRSFILAAKNIADNPKQPEWIKGDKYEAAWKKLYE
jgi:Zn-dependent M28 family amino/carboxypeptidase